MSLIRTYNSQSTDEGIFGICTYYYYDSYYNLTSVVDALNNSTAYQYDARGRITKVTNALEETQMTYDTKDRLTGVEYPDGSSISLVYDLADRLSHIVDENGNDTEYVYDAYGRLIETVYANGKSVKRYYDLMSNLIAAEDELGRVSNFEYTETDLVKKVKYPAASLGASRLEINLEYDAVGNLTKSWDTSGNKTEYVCDAEEFVFFWWNVLWKF